MCEFAKLTPIQLLEETEKAVGDPDLVQDEEKIFKKKMEERDKIWQDLKAPIEYVSRSKGSSSVISFSIHWNTISDYPGDI